LRTVFLGTSEFAAGVLRRLCTADHRPALAITRPDRPKGRGRRLSPPPVAQLATDLGIPLSQPQSVNSPQTLAEVESVEPRALIVCAFGALIREPLLSSHPMLNVHPSLLPRWRGAAPIERAIMAGDERTGVSIMQLTEGLDSGPVCLAAEEPIAPDADYGSVSARLCMLGGELLVQVLDRMGGGDPLPFLAQDEEGVTYAEKIEAADRMLDPARSALELERVVRALHPHIGARLALPGGSALGVLQARAVAQELEGAEAPPSQGVLGRHGKRLLLGLAGGEALELLQVQPPGGRAMDAEAYMRGHAL
jgi:methionyl-tRNA formyltransferase